VQANESANSANYYGDAPIHIVARATSPACAGGISAFQIHTGVGQVAYETSSSYVDTQLALDPGYHTVDIKAFDNCGGVASVHLNASVQIAFSRVVGKPREMNTISLVPSDLTLARSPQPFRFLESRLLGGEQLVEFSPAPSARSLLRSQRLQIGNDSFGIFPAGNGSVAAARLISLSWRNRILPSGRRRRTV
jgi:hypothetical protein